MYFVLIYTSTNVIYLVGVNLSLIWLLLHHAKYPKYQIEKLQWEMGDPVGAST